MTPEQRKTLDRLTRFDTLDVHERVALVAALADLDACQATAEALAADLYACRAALVPVAQSIRAGRKVPDNPTTAAAAYLNTDEAAAVLAAAWEERP